MEDFQTNLSSFIISAQNLARSAQNLGKIMSRTVHLDSNPNMSTNKSIPLIDWSKNLSFLVDRFEVELAKTQITNEQTPELCSTRMAMLFEKVQIFLNNMTTSYIDFSRSESPMSASYEYQVPNCALQKFRTIHQQQQYRRWSEIGEVASNDPSIDNNRRWSVPSNVNKTPRFIPMAKQNTVNTSQATIPDQSSSDGVIEAIQLLSFRKQQNNFLPQQHFRNQSQPHTQSRQRPSRGEVNEILVLPRTNDVGLMNLLESDEY